MNRSIFTLTLRLHAVALTAALVTGCGAADAPSTSELEATQSQALQTALTLASPPTYLGTVNDAGGCAHLYHTAGYKPGTGGKHPLFLYFGGTNVTYDGQATTTSYDAEAPLDVAYAMAQRGYVALSVEYDYGLGALVSDHVEQLRCLFDSVNAPAGLLATVCGASSGLPVDCNLGIATWGHSQGGGVALNAHNTDARVRATWATGVNGIQSSTLSPHKIRIVNGSADAFPPFQGWTTGTNNDTSELSASLGLAWTDCLGQSNQCLRSDGSGWILAVSTDLSPVRPPDHCWFDSLSCALPSRVEPNFATGSSRISIASNADWLVQAAGTP